jgi:hypothetical protein
MIYLTCDIHHQSLGTGNQKYSDRTEMDCANDFLKLLEKYKLKATYFMSGLCFKEDWGSALEEIVNSSRVELGGHNMDCFKNEFYHRVCNKLFNSYNGHKAFQKRDCELTKEIIHKHTGREIDLWRNHMYMHGKHTDDVLEDCGIRICSDGVVKGDLEPNIRNKDYVNLPINIIPDHEHIYHAERTVSEVEKWVKRYSWSDDFGPESYSIEDWGTILTDQVLDKHNQGKDCLIIIHPITMYLADGYKFVESFLNIIKEMNVSKLGSYHDFSCNENF